MISQIYNEGDLTASGSLGIEETITISALNGAGTCSISITGTWTGVLAFYASINGTTFFTIPAVNVATGVRGTDTTANGNFQVSVSGYMKVRVDAIGLSTGTADVTLRASSSESAFNQPINANITVIASTTSTSTATVSQSDQTNPFYRGIRVFLDVTAVTASPSIILTIEGKDALSGTYYTLLAGAAVATVSTNSYVIFPGATVTANVSANTFLPATWRVKVASTDTDSITYRVGASLMI